MTTPDRPAHPFVPRRADSGGPRVAFDDSPWLRWMMVPAFALMLAAAWWCTGFIQGDEHFQVLEFASARLGLSPYSDLPWEFAARARSWLLPAIAAMLRRGMIAAGHDDPFVCAFVLRAAAGALYLAAVWRFARATTGWFRSRAQWRTAVVLGLGLWFVPVVAARFTAESWSGSLFFLGFATVVRLQNRDACGAPEIAFAGAALGLAFVARFPVALLDAGAFAWLLHSRRATRREWSLLTAGALAACVAGLALDAWGYGAVSFPLWNYYLKQVPGGVLVSYGVSPWWWYGPALVQKAGWPVGLALLGGFAGVGVTRRAPALIWVLAPFILFHLAVPHKEVRFLFPMLVAAPWVIVLGLESWWPSAFVARHPLALRGVAALLIAVNAAAFAARLSMPLEPRVGVQEAIYRSGLRTVIVAGASDPYTWWDLRTNWYRPPGLRYVQVQDAAAARRLAASLGGSLVVTRFPERPDAGDGACRLVDASAPATIGPAWRALLADFIPPSDREPGWWFVSRCD